jgi:hypothetical protein
MAWEGPQIKVPCLVAGADLSAYQYCYVMLDTSVATPPTVIPVTGTTSRPIGILQNNPRLGEEAEVTILGISKVKADETLVFGDSVSVGYPAGQDTQVGGQAAKATTTAKDPNLGFVLKGAAAQAIATVTVNCANQER